MRFASLQARSLPWVYALLVASAACLPAILSGAEPGAARPSATGTLTLQEAVDATLENNLDLQIQRLEMIDAELDFDIARSTFDPSWDSSANSDFRLSPGSATELDGAVQPERRSAAIDSRVETVLPSGTSVGLASSILDRSKTNSRFRTLNPDFNSSLRLEVRQPILKNAGFRYNLSPIRLAKLGIESGDHELRLEILQRLAETEIAYWDAVGAEAEARITRRSLELSELILAEAQERRQAALATETEVLEAQSALAERQEIVLVAEARVFESRDQLFRSVGVLLDNDPEDVDLERLPPVVQVECDARSSYDMAKSSTPSLLLAKIETERRREEMLRRKNQLLPSLDLAASTGVLGRGATFSSAQDSLREAGGHFWDVGLQFSLPLGQRADRARLQQSQNALERSKLQLENARLDLFTLIRSACRQIDLAQKRLEASAVTLDFAERKLAQQRANYREGQVAIRDVLEAQGDLDAARIRLLQARLRQLRAIVELAELEGTLPNRYGLAISDTAPPVRTAVSDS